VYLLDTNTIIYFFKKEGLVSERLLAVSPDRIGVPVIVVYEIEFGIAKSRYPGAASKQLEEFLACVTIFPFGRPESTAAAGIRARLELSGHPIGPWDTLIAGTAVANHAVLVSRNIREFGRIKELKIENWY
jgi:tRNA(fMet)-specific endonuclease VapC